MKKASILFFLLTLFLVNKGNAQSKEVTNAWNYLRYDELDKAKASIDAASKHEQTMNDPKTWLYRGNVYEKLASSKKPEFKAINANALEEAVASYKKSIELDPKNKYTEDSKPALQRVANEIYKTAADAYNQQKFEIALNSFQTYLGAVKTLNPSFVDTHSIFYTGISAYKVKDVAKAKEYLGKLSDLKFKDPFVYLTLSDIYKEEKDTVKALSILQTGMNQASDKRSILIDELNIYIKQGKVDKAIEKGKKAIELDPKNTSIYLALGTIYQNLGKTKEAEEVYNQALAVDPDNFNTNYLLGINYFNAGADTYNKSVKEKDAKKIAKLEEQSNEEFKKAIPYLEKAHKADPKDGDTMRVLAEIYAKLGDFAKAKEYKDKLQSSNKK